MGTAAGAPLLVLWDIDGTLVNGGTVARRAYDAAFRQVAGRGLEHPWRFDGRTELAAATEVLRIHGLDPEGGLLERFLDLIVTELQGRSEELAAEGRALPGAARALDALATLPGVHQTVLTGNLFPLAELKVTVFGLEPRLDLRIGAFGGDAYERTDLPAHAFRRSEQHLGRAFDGSHAVIVGDTPRDMATARAAGARAVAVATGVNSAEELAAAGADVVLPDLADTARVLRAITGREQAA